MKYAVARDDSMDKGVAPVRERGLKWKISALTAGYNLVAPVRERGLKLLSHG